MSAVFLKVLNMSIAAGWLILAVVLARLILKKAPRWVFCLLWGLAAVRLICPFSLESPLSLIPSRETVPANIELQAHPHIESGIELIDEAVNPLISGSFTPAPTDSANPLQVWIPIIALIWIVGMAVMLTYALISYVRLKKSVAACVPAGEGMLACDEVETPFILGVLRPVIYVPYSMDDDTLDQVIRHERAHLARRDHWWKPLSFLLLSVHWFDPLCWLAYMLFCRDIEAACDERVISGMDREGMAAYSQALLDCSLPRKRIAACPLAFGEVGVKERVKGILNYRKPAFWVVIAAVLVCIVLAVCLMTDPGQKFMIKRSEVDKVTYFNKFAGDDCQGELGPAGIDEMVGRISAIKIANKSSRYDGMTPGYQLSVLIKDGSYVYANGYHAEDDMVEIIYKGKRYSVADLEFAKYLRNICRYGDPSDLEFLRDKYPEYFDLRTAKGLEVYVWQMSPGSYSCGVMEGTNREKTLEELMGLKGASIHEMKAILSSYDIPKEDMIIIPWQDPVSSYMPEYLIGQKDEDPAAAEKRKQEYIDGIRKMLFE